MKEKKDLFCLNLFSLNLESEQVTSATHLKSQQMLMSCYWSPAVRLMDVEQQAGSPLLSQDALLPSP